MLVRLFAVFLIPAALVSQPLSVCDLFQDLRSFNGKSVQIEGDVFLDERLSLIAADCDAGFLEESLVWPTAVHIDAGPELSGDGKEALERARSEVLQRRARGLRMSVYAVLEGRIELRECYVLGTGGRPGNGFGPEGSIAAQLVLTNVRRLETLPLPPPEELPVIPICELFRDLLSYNGKRIAVRGEVIGGYLGNGELLAGRNCPEHFVTNDYIWDPILSIENVRYGTDLIPSPQFGSSRPDEPGTADILQGRKNVREIWTVVGVLRARDSYTDGCDESLGWQASGFGDMGSAPAEFFEETRFDLQAEPRSGEDDGHHRRACPVPDRATVTDCQEVDGLVEAAGKGCAKRLQIIATPERLSAEGAIAMRCAAVLGYADIVQLLVEAGVSPNATVEHESILSAAIQYDRADVVEVLMRAGATLQASKTPMRWVAHRGGPETIRTVLSHGADIEDRALGQTPLMVAAKEANREGFRTLIEAGADVNARDKDGVTCLCRYGATYNWVARDLIGHGANVDCADAHGVTILMKAARNGRDDIARDLLEAGAAVNLRDPKGNTALHHAALGGATDAVPVLLEFGADPEARNGEGKRPAGLEPETVYIMFR